MSSPGDVLGVESCIDLRANIDMDNSQSRCSSVSSSNSIRSNCSSSSTGGYRSFTPAKAMKMNMQIKYPPPLPSLGMEMRRYCTADGRLIIREEKTSRPLHDMFRADRSNGRLTLHLVRFEDACDQNDSVFGDFEHNDNDGVFQMDDDNEVEVVPAASCKSMKKHGFVVKKRVLT